MRKIVLLAANLAVLMFVALLTAEQAEAQYNYISYVKTTGDGTACTPAFPCQTFGAAQGATVTNGEIRCLDSGGIGGTTITKSLTIDCPGFATAANGLIVDGLGIVVTIRNLTFNGVYGGFSSGIEFRNGAALLVENCIFENYSSTSGAAGIKFRPAVSSKLVVTDTVMRNNGTGSTGGGIVINPLPGGAAEVVLNRVSVNKNIFGIVADGTGSTTGINMTITDSVSTSNFKDAIIATTPGGGAPIAVVVKNTRAVSSAFGIRSLGTGVTVRTDGSSIIGNTTGLSFASGGALLSAGNNLVEANAANGVFSGQVALK